ncbi:MAG TPA: response regulator transcription factor [Actinomycetota bacterium]|nr:response regulator transcription factor [Actinomycetota bacterium]
MTLDANVSEGRPALKTLIAEDHTLVSQGLEVMLSRADEVDLVGVVATGEAAVERAEREQLDVILMDVNLGKAMNGIEATRLVKEKAPDTRVLILTMFTDPGTVAEAVKAGADGYLSKGASKEVVVQAIKDVAEGKSVLDPNVTEGIFGRIGGRDPQALTDRELTVLQELTHGKSTREVAEHIHVSEETVTTYLKQIFRKLEVHDRTEAVAEAFRRGLVH